MKRIILGLVFAAFACCPVLAQNSVRMQAQAVTSCGTQSLTAGVYYPAFQDATGVLCILGGGTASNPTIVSGNVSNASSGVAPTSTNVPTNASNYTWNGTTWDQSLGLLAGTPGAPGADVVTVQAPITAGTAGFPVASTPIQGNAIGTTGAVVGTLAANATKTTYLCDFDVSALGTASSIGPIVVAGLLGGSKTYQMGTLATGTQQILSKNFNPCLPASAINTTITITTTADATATAVDVNSSGFQQ